MKVGTDEKHMISCQIENRHKHMGLMCLAGRISRLGSSDSRRGTWPEFRVIDIHESATPLRKLLTVHKTFTELCQPFAVATP